MLHRLTVLASLLMATLLVACQPMSGEYGYGSDSYGSGAYGNGSYGQQQGGYGQDPYANQGGAAGSPYGQQTGASPEDYPLGAGDKLRIIVFEEEDLSGEFQVDGTGIVSLPLIGQIRAQGLTVRQLERSIEEALRGRYLRDPRVSAEVLDFRPYYILGEVNRPGTYPYSSGLTVLNAVATAEGFTYRANQRVVYIRRAGEGQERQYPLNSTTSVNPGDTIRIAERIF